MTVAAANDVILTNNLTTAEDSSGNPTGSATPGIVANQYVRIKHDCTGNPTRTIDAAILTLQHSFFVDNYGCGGTPLGTPNDPRGDRPVLPWHRRHGGRSGYLKQRQLRRSPGADPPAVPVRPPSTRSGRSSCATLCSPVRCVSTAAKQLFVHRQSTRRVRTRGGRCPPGSGSNPRGNCDGGRRRRASATRRRRSTPRRPRDGREGLLSALGPGTSSRNSCQFKLVDAASGRGPAGLATGRWSAAASASTRSAGR